MFPAEWTDRYLAGCENAGATFVAVFLLFGVRRVLVLFPLLFSLPWPIHLLLDERFLSGCQVRFSSLYPFSFLGILKRLCLIFSSFLLWSTDA